MIVQIYGFSVEAMNPYVLKYNVYRKAIIVSGMYYWNAETRRASDANLMA
ncbi:MAG: hypothetical protein ACI8UP_002484 [Porticoccaceae bacterium]|jgi:hypothetical protein